MLLMIRQHAVAVITCEQSLTANIVHAHGLTTVGAGIKHMAVGKRSP